MAGIEANNLDHVAFFAALTPAQRDEVVKSCRWRRYAANEQIIDRQDESRDIYFVVEGAARIIIYSLGGREVTLADLCPGEYFGELAAIDGAPREASVVSLGPTVVAIMSSKQFVHMIGLHPDLALDVMRRLSSVVRISTNRIMELSTLGATNRVHAELLRRAHAAKLDELGRPIISPIPIHGDIAGRVSTTRETVARVLNDLARGDIVKRERDALVVLDIGKLEDLVSEVCGEPMSSGSSD